ncbi:MAG TPA: rhodanese-like domain-containing protein [Gemmatimonadaceae bacterium]|nr:rhodanese-like domain-containing protein [Gemmatimonadaceae bacterium]
MLLRRFYDDTLAQASYLIGCQSTGESLVVDPNRDVARYLAAAAADGLRATHVTETHIHADFVSGARELAAAAGARLLLSGEGGADWSYRFAREANATLLRDGDAFDVGRVRIGVMHTPGHTPEHLTFLVTDRASADQPMGALTGDFVFVGDVGRPDLLERAAGVAGTMESSARALFASLRRFKSLPDYLQLWPGHGAGSACGKSLGAVPQTTLGYERLFNWALAADDEEEFVAAVLAGQPEPPGYFARMKRINRDGPPPLGALPRPAELPADSIRAALARGDAVIDMRTPDEFAAAHVPGTLNVPRGRSFSAWTASLTAEGQAVVLVVPTAAEATEAARDLALVGVDRLEGFVTPEAALREQSARGAPATTTQSDVRALAASLDGGRPPLVLDVRGTDEWNAGHVPGAVHIPLSQLPSRAGELPRDRRIAVHCQGGSRSAIAASVLEARGLTDVTNVRGGFAEWKNAGMPVEAGDTPAAVR